MQPLLGGVCVCVRRGGNRINNKLSPLALCFAPTSGGAGPDSAGMIHLGKQGRSHRAAAAACPHCGAPHAHRPSGDSGEGSHWGSIPSAGAPVWERCSASKQGNPKAEGSQLTERGCGCPLLTRPGQGAGGMRAARGCCRDAVSALGAPHCCTGGSTAPIPSDKRSFSLPSATRIKQKGDPTTRSDPGRSTTLASEAPHSPHQALPIPIFSPALLPKPHTSPLRSLRQRRTSPTPHSGTAQLTPSR